MKMISRYWPHILVALVALCWLLRLLANGIITNDFYPVYYGAQRVLEGLSPYGTEAAQELSTRWIAPPNFGTAGVAYPLPLLLLVIPLTLLSVSVATMMWITLGFVTTYLSVFIKQHQGWYRWIVLLLPFTFWPVYRGVELAQTTLLWTGLIALLLLGIQRRFSSLVAVCAVLLMLKPQNGAIFALYGLYWLLQYHRRMFFLSLLLGISLLGVSLIVYPYWIHEWLAQVQTYDEMVTPLWLLPIGIIPLLACLRLRLHLFAVLAITQVVLFPLSDLYSAVPLLFAWLMFPPPLALLGTAISWIPIFSGQPTYLDWSQLSLFILAPLFAVAMWEGRPRQVRKIAHTVVNANSAISVTFQNH